MDNFLIIKDIDIIKEWNKTLLAKLGKKKPSEGWICQLVRIRNKKYKRKVYKYFRNTNMIKILPDVCRYSII